MKNLDRSLTDIDMYCALLIDQARSLTPDAAARICDARGGGDRGAAWVVAKVTVKEAGRIELWGELLERVGTHFYSLDTWSPSGVRHAAFDAVLALATADLTPSSVSYQLLSAWSAGGPEHAALVDRIIGIEPVAGPIELDPAFCSRCQDHPVSPPASVCRACAKRG